MVRFLNILLLAVLAGFGAWFLFEDELRTADRKILFVGNSYIFVGNVPDMVERMAASASPPVIYHTRMIAKPDYRLAQHIEEGEVEAEIETGVWDVIVLQEQSSGAFSLVARSMMADSMAKLEKMAGKTGAQIILYAHWPPVFVPPQDRGHAVEQIAEVYDRRARETGSRVAGVGALWQAAWDDGMADLYAPDGHHASTLGAYAAAVAVLVALGDVDPATVTWAPSGVSQDQAIRLRDLAAAQATN